MRALCHARRFGIERDSGGAWIGAGCFLEIWEDIDGNALPGEEKDRRDSELNHVRDICDLWDGPHDRIFGPWTTRSVGGYGVSASPRSVNQLCV